MAGCTEFLDDSIFTDDWVTLGCKNQTVWFSRPRNSQQNTQDRCGGFYDQDSSQHLCLLDDSRRQRNATLQHGNQHFSQASDTHNTRNNGEGNRYREGAARSKRVYDWFHSAEQYSTAYNIPHCSLDQWRLHPC